ncbi:hypothetical protein LLS1_04810 [Leifsonia sp. LS1]|uniref:aminomethyl transferase family protein n=1 Tax=Leifsonia sp. LS1 TaxID=2828483 RepID=UPI001CFD2E70|nr:aminomethyl transferase family protein [Leifsonia sp. LS1]GIT78812.1 hypothetical protein LLS1_04810 [Leifsonia sp. LS1]
MKATEGYTAIRETAATYPRGTQLVELTGPGRQQLLNLVLARPTEYAQPGTVAECLALDEAGNAIDLILCIIDESRIILLSDTEGGVITDLSARADAAGIGEVTIRPLPGWSAAAIEGPRSWRAVADVPDEDIAAVLLNEWRRVDVPPASSPGFLARTGGTAEYGYLIVAEADSDALLSWLTSLATDVGGEPCSMDAIIRARVEANHPVLGPQFDGVDVYEAGAAWMAGMERDDPFCGRIERADAPSRRLVAVLTSEDVIEGAEVRYGNRVVGRVQFVAPRVGQPTMIALALLEKPFDVPGLSLVANSAELRTVARPTIDPVSWVESIE